MGVGLHQTMVRCVVEHIVALPEDQIAGATLEDMALAQAWYASMEPQPDEREFAEPLPERLRYWLGLPEGADAGANETEGRRQQPLIRALVDAAAAHPENVNASEWAVLRNAFELAQNASRSFVKLNTLLAPLLRTNVARGAEAPEPGLPHADDRVRLIAGIEIRRARPRNIRYFAGVDLPAFGPVLAVPGNVKVIDSIPDESILVAENGTCTVGSYVLGRVAARTGCEVRENISGVVVVREGNIRARNAVSGAFVVSKWGGVYLRNAVAPTLLFAGERVAIYESATQGTFASPMIEVSGDATSGSWSVSTAMRAGRFRQTDAQKMDVALRYSISYEDYGGLIAPEATKLLHRLARVRRNEGTHSTMMRLARDECEHFASNAVMFLLGGDTLRQDIETISATRRRLAFLDRVIAGIDAATVSAEERLRDAERDQSGEEAAPENVDFEGLEDELGQIESEGSVGDDLREEGQRLVAMAKQAKTGGPRRALSATGVFQLREKKTNWLAERVSLQRELEGAELRLRETVGRTALLDGQNGEISKVQLLSKILTAARQRPPGDPIHDRAKAKFVVLMLRAIDARRKRLQKYAKMIEESRAEKKALAETLEAEHHIRARLEDEERDPPLIEGRFDLGITLCTDRYLLREKDVPPGHVVRTFDTGERVVRYIRTDRGIVEAT